jgi:hypothetical protein
MKVKVKVSMIILSHLSDIQEDLVRYPNNSNTRINFVKYLTLKYTNTDTEVDPYVAFEEFKAKHSSLVNA